MVVALGERILLRRLAVVCFYDLRGRPSKRILGILFKTISIQATSTFD